MKKYFLAFILSIATICITAALQVDEDELQSASSKDVLFENYNGPHAVIESVGAITGIGEELGRVVAANIESPVTVNQSGKYTLMHTVSFTEQNKLDADILFINRNASVDHIINLRRIISGYLVAAYGYSRDDADTLAVFITVYNAVYRGELSVFNNKYKSAVLDNLTENDIGLSSNWADWAGKSQIVIPLGNTESGISIVDTSVISDEQVIDALRKEENMGIEPRKNMVDIKERESDIASENAQNAQKDAVKKRAEAAEARKLAETQQNADKLQELAEKSAQTAETEQQAADKKKLEATAERNMIEKDLQELAVINSANYITGLFAANEKPGLYGLVTVDGISGTVIRVSKTRQIKDKNIYTVSEVAIQGDIKYQNMFVAVCAKSDSKPDTKLCLIDAATLEVKKESEESLFDKAAPIRIGDNFYVVIVSDDEYFIGCYDKNLSLKSKSDMPVQSSTPLNATEKGIMVTNKKGAQSLLDISDLSTVW